MASSDTAADDTVRVPHDSGGLPTAEIGTPEVVLQQLDRILASRFFSSTKRYSGLLRYLVERTLNGAADTLKERTIGIEVFGRSPEYDSNTDHVVRSAAGEIRKRLAQYYLEEGRETELRIEVPPGAYIPRFRKPVESAIATTSPIPARQISWPAKIATVVAAALLVLLGVALAVPLRSKNAVDRFWMPLTASDRPILLCVGDNSRLAASIAATAPDSIASPDPHAWSLGEFARFRAPRVMADDAIALARLAAAIQPRHKDIRILAQSEATLEDLRGVPTVLIGLASNEWTMRLTGQERFSVLWNRRGNSLIRDREHPLRDDWAVDFSKPYLQCNRDYAIVSRIRNPTTEQVVVLVGGIYAFGNIGAAEFLSNPDYLKKLEAYAPSGWEWKNLEFVLSVDVIEGKTGVPRVLAAHFW